MESSRTKSGQPFVTALARGLEVLRCFDQPRIALTVTDIARRVGLSQPTAWRLCATLIECGYLIRQPHSALLSVGAPALTLGYAALAGLNVPAIVRPYMAQLSADVQGSATLSLRQELEMVAIDRVDGGFVVRNQPIGWRSPLYSVPSGLAVLTSMPTAQRARIEADLRALAGDDWPRHEARIERAAVQLERDRYVVRTNMLQGQYAAVAIPLIAGHGDLMAEWALSCGGVRTIWTAQHLQTAGTALVALRALLQPALATLTI